jgi:phosphate transport system permease protein
VTLHATASRAPLRRTERRGHRVETALARSLAALAAILAGGYLAGLAYLLLRGSSKLFAFSINPVPRTGVEGEEIVRTLIATMAFGLSAWAITTLAQAVLRRISRSEKTPRLATWKKIAISILVIVLGITLCDYVPSFLVTLPSETTAGGGIGPEIFNTLYFAILSTAITLPIGVGAAVYMARFAMSPTMMGALRTALDTLASLPSIVYGLFGFLVFVVQMQAGYSLFAGALVLALLNLPLVVGISEESLRAVPRELEDASLALGATRVQTTLRVTLPYAWPGILSALVLSVGRVFAESAPLIMTAGTTISRTNAFSLNPFRGGETLAVHLWYVNSSGLSPDKADVSAGTAAVLIVLIFLTNLAASRLARFGGATGNRLKKATR